MYDEPHIIKSRMPTPLRERRPRPTALGQAFNDLFADEQRENRLRELRNDFAAVDRGDMPWVEFTEDFLLLLPMSTIKDLHFRRRVVEVTRLGDMSKVYRYEHLD